MPADYGGRWFNLGLGLHDEGVSTVPAPAALVPEGVLQLPSHR